MGTMFDLDDRELFLLYSLLDRCLAEDQEELPHTPANTPQYAALVSEIALAAPLFQRLRRALQTRTPEKLRQYDALP